MEGIVIVVCFLIFLGLIYIGVSNTISYEKERYNNGICPICGHKLHYFQSDSSGARQYICTICHNYTAWVSYDCVDKN